MALGGGGGGSSAAVRAGRAFVELFAEDSKLRRGLEAAKARVTRFAKSFGSAGLAIAGLGVGTAAAAAGVGKVMETLGDTGKMGAAARAFGVTGEAASGLFGALEAHGGEFKEDLEGMTQFAQKVRDAFDGTGEEAKKLFAGLKVSAKDIINLPLDEQFYRMHDAIRALPQKDQMSKLSMLGGTDSMKKWLSLLSVSNPELRAQAKALALTNAEMDAAADAAREYTNAVALVTSVWRKVVAAVAPAIGSVASVVAKAAAPLSKWVSENKAVVVAVVAVGTAVAAAGAVILGFGAAALLVASAISGVITLGSVLASAFAAIPAVLAAVFSPIGLVVGLALACVAVFAALAVAAVVMSQDVRDGIMAAVGVVGDVLAFLLEDVTKTWGGVVASVKAGDMALAGRVLMAGLKVEFAKGIAVLAEMWKGLMDLILGSTLGSLMEPVTGLANEALAKARADLAKLVEQAKAAAAAAAANGGGGGGGDGKPAGPLPGSTKSVIGAFNARSLSGVFGGGSGKPEAKQIVAELKRGNAIQDEQLRLLREGKGFEVKP